MRLSGCEIGILPTNPKSNLAGPVGRELEPLSCAPKGPGKMNRNHWTDDGLGL